MSEDGNVPFALVAEDLVYPVPLGAAGDILHLLHRLRSAGAETGAQAETREEEGGRRSRAKIVVITRGAVVIQ